MYYPERKIALKNGKEALFRSPSPEDAALMMDFLKNVSGETEFLLRCPEECDDPLEQEVAFLTDILGSETKMMIACVIDGEVAGNCQINFYNRIKTRHRASVAIAIRKKYWGLGIGTEMFREMIAAANRRQGILQLELEFIEGNERARRLYEKMGFGIVSERPDAIRLRDGSFRKEYTMIKKLAQQSGQD